MKKIITKLFTDELSQIRKLLDSIEDNYVWLIKTDARFRIGQRVEFSRRARRRGINSRTKSDTGIIKNISGFSIVVLLDGYKHTKSFHHAFFNPVKGPKLF